MKPELSPRKIVKRLKDEGWELSRVQGSHHVFFHPVRKQILVLPVHGNRDLAPGTARSIAKTAGWK